MGYRLLACDGSDVNIARNPDDAETFIHEGEKGNNALHINPLYDLLDHTYYDVEFQGKKKLHERAAFNTMVDRYHDSATAVNICKDYLKNGGDEDERLRLIQKHLTPIRPDRKYPMKLRPKRNRDFMYRTA